MNKRNFGASNETPYGEYDEDGRIKKDVGVCAITGRNIAPGDPLITVPGSNVFYRVSAVAFRSLGGKQAALERIEQRVKSPETPAAVTSEPTAPAVKNKEK